MKLPRVLVMEDTELISSQLAPLVTERKIEATRVNSGFDGLEAARENPCDLILLEMKLHDLTGVEVLRRIKRSRRLREIPIVVVEGAAGNADEKEALELGAVHYVRRPIDGADFLERVTTILKNRPAPERLLATDTEQRIKMRDDLLRLSKVAENASDAVWMLEPSGRVSYVNPSFERLFGVPLGDCRDKEKLRQVFTNEKQWGEIWDACFESGNWSGEVSMRGASGAPLSVHLRVLVVRDDSSNPLGVVALATNLTQRKQMEQDLVFLTDRDPLTGLWNRRSFAEILHHAIADARGGIGSFLLFLDLDHFRVVNSSLGTAAADRLLKDVSRVLREGLRRGDEVGRFGSDEFVILLRRVDETQAVEVARRLLRKLDAVRFVEQGKYFSANASLGISVIDGTEASEEVYARAHSACHDVKSRGRNDFLIYRAESREMQKLAAEATWSIRIREAIRSNRMEIWLQPILPLSAAQPRVYFEVLLRMLGADGTVVLPGEFLPAAERFGNMLQLDRFALKESVALMAEHKQFNLSINLSARSLKEDDLPKSIHKLLSDAMVDPHRVAFEVTETTMIEDLVQARKLLLEIREFGCRVFLDDFGSGASSMTYLRDLPVDVLKIDGSFFHTVDADQTSRTLVKTMNEMAHALNKLTVAEHVMSASVLRTARELQLDYAQGWFVCEPARPTEFVERGISKLTLFAP